MTRQVETLAKMGMKTARAKTEYNCQNGKPLGSVKSQSALLPRITEFKYIMCKILQSNGYMNAEVYFYSFQRYTILL